MTLQLGERERLRDDAGRQFTGPCDGCGQPVGIWMILLEHDAGRTAMLAFEQGHPSLPTAEVPAELRRYTMPRPDDDKAMLTTWVSCLSCGYDGIHMIGSPS